MKEITVPIIHGVLTGLAKGVPLDVLMNKHDISFADVADIAEANGIRLPPFSGSTNNTADVVAESNLRQRVVAAVLTGCPLKEVRKRFGLSKRQVRNIMKAANIRVGKSDHIPELGVITTIKEGKDAWLGMRVRYDTVAEGYKENVAEALDKHRSMKSKVSDIAPQHLDWYYVWSAPEIGVEHILMDLHEFIKVVVSKCAPCKVACKMAKLKLRISDPVPVLPMEVAHAIAETAEQWWRDPKVIERMDAVPLPGGAVDPYKEFGLL